ncbi:MAG TPA: VanW family protein, partial [Pyrinomonadaceae bacterium]|nr:VanW family protein [Pyrinomonadaceae bacterium]
MLVQDEMSSAANGAPEKRTPGIGDAIIFRCKATLLQTKRGARNFLGREVERFSAQAAHAGQRVIAESVTPLWREGEQSEISLTAGKVHNLRLALRKLNGVEVPAGRVFSFWKQVGRASRRKGYVNGRELREGCIIPTVGGGLCQLSNALYDAALRAGFEIVERHAHTQVVSGSLAEAGRDATVFWNYVDLRFKSRRTFRIEALMDADYLIVRFKGDADEDFQRGNRAPAIHIRKITSDGTRSCLSCGVRDCFRHAGSDSITVDFGRAAYLVDEFWPEFDCYISQARHEHDLLCLPLDGNRWARANYAWKTDGFGQVRQQRLFTALRAYGSRRLAMQGAERQRALLAAQEKLARGYAAHLAFDVAHVTLMQSLLPFLWRDGALGGRTFDVLMTALPLARLHERLDAAS